MCIARAQVATLSGALLSTGARPTRPARLACDLHKHSPLVAIFKGAEPSAILAATELGPLANRSGYKVTRRVRRAAGGVAMRAACCARVLCGGRVLRRARAGCARARVPVCVRASG